MMAGYNLTIDNLNQHFIKFLFPILITMHVVTRLDAEALAKDGSRRSNATYAFRLRLFDNETTLSPWAFPKAVEVTKRLFAEVQLRPLDNNDIDQDLLAIPKDCFFSTNSNPSIEKESQRVVLKSGCSVDKAAAMFYKPSNDVQQSVNNHGVRFSVVIDSFYFPNYFMFFHCRATVCSSTHARPDQNIQKCPVDDFCVPALDEPASATQYTNVFSGPLRPVQPRLKGADPSGSVPAWTIDGNRRPPPLHPKTKQLVASLRKVNEQRCPPCPADDLFLVDAATENANLRLEGRGIDTLTVFCIAASAFLVGVLLMAGLCYVHKITEPKKCTNTANSCRKPLVERPHSSLMANNYDAAPNNAQNPAVARTLTKSNGNGHMPANNFSANSVLLLAKPKLKLPCCYDPVEQNDEEDKGQKVARQQPDRPFIEMQCDSNNGLDSRPLCTAQSNQTDDC